MPSVPAASSSVTTGMRVGGAAGGRSARPEMRRVFSGDLFNPGVKTFPSVFVRVCPSRGDGLLKHLMAVKKCFQPLERSTTTNLLVGFGS